MTAAALSDDLLDDRQGIVGNTGSGKTYGAGTAVERVLALGGRCVIPDPLGVWWGLRLARDGKTASPYNVVIFGGPHADLPLTEHSGALIGETAAGMAESAILDLSELGTKAAERRFMLAFLTALYRHASGEPVHLIFDEADMWAPQQPRDREGEAIKLLGMMETVVRRGRVKGFIPWLITQRPAVVNKDVLSQVDGLVAFKLTSSQDRDALGAWVEGQADKAEWKRIYADLATRKRGEALIWQPARRVMKTATFPAKETFDSSRTPKRGEAKHTRQLKPLDVSALRDRLATVEQEVKANDPKALKAEVAALRKQLSNTTAEQVPKQEIAAAERQGYERGEAEGSDRVMRAVAKLATDLAKSIGRAREASTDAERLLSSFAGFVESQADEIARRPPPAPAPVPRSALPAPRPPVINQDSGTVDGMTQPLQRIIDAVAWWNVLGVPAPKHPQVAFIAGYSHKSGTWATYLSRLRTMGLLEGRGDLVLTDSGRAVVNAPSVPPSGAALRETVLAKIDAPLARILAPILAAYPNDQSHAEVAEVAGYSSASGTWATYLSKLRSLDLIEGRGALKAQDWLFP